MATVVRIPPQNTIYDSIRIAINESRFNDAFTIYENMSPQESLTFMDKYPELYILLNEIYVREKVTTATDTRNF